MIVTVDEEQDHGRLLRLREHHRDAFHDLPTLPTLRYMMVNHISSLNFMMWSFRPNPASYTVLTSTVPKLEDLRIKDCQPEMKQPTSVHRPNS